MKDEKIEISKIVLNIGKKEISLTPEQASELRDSLCNLLGNRPNLYPQYYSGTYSNNEIQPSHTITCSDSGTRTIYIDGTGSSKCGVLNSTQPDLEIKQ